jgi:hypothetical protein
MKTERLVAMLATGVGAEVPAAGVARRHARALLACVPAMLALVVVTYRLLPWLHQALAMPMFWVKVGFVAASAAAGLGLSARLSRPGARLGPWPLVLALPLVAIWGLAIAQWFGADPVQRGELLFGRTWRSCAFNIACVSIPGMIAFFWAVRGLAPTRLRLAGAVVGWLSGALGATVYSLHCPELTAPFLAVWYVLGMGLSAAIGAALGPRVLRW